MTAGPWVFRFSCQQKYFCGQCEKLVPNEKKKKLVVLVTPAVAMSRPDMYWMSTGSITEGLSDVATLCKFCKAPKLNYKQTVTDLLLHIYLRGFKQSNEDRHSSCLYHTLSLWWCARCNICQCPSSFKLWKKKIDRTMKWLKIIKAVVSRCSKNAIPVTCYCHLAVRSI